MKKRLLSLVMVFAILFVFGATAMAYQDRVVLPDGEYVGMDETGNPVKISSNQEIIEVYLMDDQGIEHYVKMKLESDAYGNNNYISVQVDSTIISERGLFGAGFALEDSGEYSFFVDLSSGMEGVWSPGALWGTVAKVSDAPFTGTQIINGSTISKTGEYFAVVGGSISGTFQNGTHNIKATDHNLSIFLINQLNGQTRQMTSSTINSMSVTVAGGQITKIVINGRAQTTPGGFDTYTLTINY